MFTCVVTLREDRIPPRVRYSKQVLADKTLETPLLYVCGGSGPKHLAGWGHEDK